MFLSSVSQLKSYLTDLIQIRSLGERFPLIEQCVSDICSAAKFVGPLRNLERAKNLGKIKGISKIKVYF